MKDLDLGQLGQLLRGRMGLIVGPHATLRMSSASIQEELAKHLDAEAQEDLFRIIESYSAKQPSDDIPRTISAFASNRSAAIAVGHLAKIRWSAVLSFSWDRHLEAAIRDNLASTPGSYNLLSLTDLQHPIPSRTVPSFKLLGASDSAAIPISHSAYLKRRAGWQTALASFKDLVKGNPVLVAGIGSMMPYFWELLSISLQSRGGRFSNLVFLNEDVPDLGSTTLELIPNDTKVFSLKTQLGPLVSAAVNSEKRRYVIQTELDLLEHDSPSVQCVTEQPDLFVHMASAAEPQCVATDHNSIVQQLVSPDRLGWDPFIFDYDFERTVQNSIVSDVRSSENESSSISVLIGSGCSGKTSLLKRVAIQVHQQAVPTLWCRRWVAEGAYNALNVFFRRYSKLRKKHDSSSLLIVLDDPFAFGSLRIEDIARAASNSRVKIKLLVGIRSSDWSSESPESISAGLTFEKQHALPDCLDDSEWSRLPDFLVKLRIAATLQDAQEQLSRVENRSARDTLGTVYWLLPDVRESIRGSVKEEYFRLGSQNTLRQIIFGGLNHSLDVLKQAWAMAAVAERYHAQLPIEVLIGSLEINYDDWISAAQANSQGFGLLYEEYSDDSSTIWVKTRNSIVTETLLEVINSGRFGYSGEFTLLKQMFESCRDHTSVVYREFLTQILVPTKKIDHLEPKDGLSLFEKAIDVLARPDKLIQHHLGIWIKNKLNDPILAEQALQKALSSSNPPYSEGSGENNRNIYTTLAANDLQKIDQQQISYDDGKASILDHLSRARSVDTCDAKIAHIQAKLVSRLVRKSQHIDADSIALVNRATADLDRALIQIGTSQRSNKRQQKDERLLSEARDHLQEFIADLDRAKELAQELWGNHSSQQGFTLVARILARRAIIENRGGAFKKADDYCIFCFREIESSGANIAPDLSEVAVHNLCKWMLPQHGVSNAKMDWVRLQQLVDNTLLSTDLAVDPFNRFLQALCFAQLGKWAESSAVFAALKQGNVPRDILFSPRLLLANADGRAWKVQGQIRAVGEKSFLSVEELGTDLLVDNYDRWRTKGEEEFAYVQFSFAGPRAISIHSAGLRWGV